MNLTQLETDTLTALYDDADNWWFFLWCLSDRIAEEDEDAARFVRWLCGVRQRPMMTPVHPPTVEHDYFIGTSGYWHWWTSSTDKWALQWAVEESAKNYLPTLFASVCLGYPVAGVACAEIDYPTAVAALVAACDCWKTLTETQKAEIERVWKLEAAHA